MAAIFETSIPITYSERRRSRHYGKIILGGLAAVVMSVLAETGANIFINIEEQYQQRQKASKLSFLEAARLEAVNSAGDPAYKRIPQVHNTYALQQVENPDGSRYFRYITVPAIYKDELGNHAVIGATTQGLLEAWAPKDYILCGQNSTPPEVVYDPMPYNNATGSYTANGIARMANAGSADQLPAPCDYAINLETLGLEKNDGVKKLQS
jgi:hypothetical protein